MLRVITFSMLCIVSLYAQGQSVDTIGLLAEVEVIGYPALRSGTYQNGFVIDSTTLRRYESTSISELLSQNTSIFIKSYGANSLSTISMRGFSASHTAVLWNGMNINSGLNGLIDFNLISLSAIDQVSILNGTQGAAWGSGAIGGTILMNDVVRYNKNDISISLNKASFETFRAAVNSTISNKKLWSNTAASFAEGKYDYTYRDILQVSKPIVHLQNNQAKNFSFTQSVGVLMSPTTQLLTGLWFSNVDRAIPASISSKPSSAMQQDESWRGYLNLLHTTNTFSIRFNNSIQDQKLNFQDPQIAVDSKNDITSYQSEVELNKNLNQELSILAGAIVLYDAARTNNFNADHSRLRHGVFTSLKWHTKTLSLTGILRQEWVYDGEKPTTASINYQHAIATKWQLEASISRGFRLPTFNDLYWSQGGNPLLKSEYSLNTEAGVSYLNKSPTLEVKAKVNVYNSHVNNWILWSPKNNTIWSPDNLLTVNSRGIEHNLSFKNTKNNVAWQISLHEQYCRTVNTEDQRSNVESLGKQLIYTPRYIANASADLFYKKWSINFSQRYTSSRYTTTDNSEKLPPFNVGHLLINRSVSLKNKKIVLGVGVHNIWNSTYEIIPYYPMPLRTYEIKINCEFKK
jgi:vitamin B12 transporter